MSCSPRTTQSKSSFGSVGGGAELDTAGLVLGFHARGEGDGHEHLALVLYFVVGFMLNQPAMRLTVRWRSSKCSTRWEASVSRAADIVGFGSGRGEWGETRHRRADRG